MHQRRALVLIAILTAGVAASAQTLHQGHGTKATCKDTPASKAFRAANGRMHAGMNISFSIDPTRTSFVA
jgi:hypothetical protein